MTIKEIIFVSTICLPLFCAVKSMLMELSLTKSLHRVFVSGCGFGQCCTTSEETQLLDYCDVKLTLSSIKTNFDRNVCFVKSNKNLLFQHSRRVPKPRYKGVHYALYARPLIHISTRQLQSHLSIFFTDDRTLTCTESLTEKHQCEYSPLLYS